MGRNETLSASLKYDSTCIYMRTQHRNLWTNTTFKKKEKSFSRKSDSSGKVNIQEESHSPGRVSIPGRQSFSRKSQYPGRESFSRKSDWSWQRVPPDDDNCKLVENTALTVCKPCPPRHSHNFDVYQWRR